MYGLIMLREYFEEIISGEKAYDARSYDTSKRGIIALVDTRKSEIIATIELVSTHVISAKEYCLWHQSGKWKDFIFHADEQRTYYAYDFKNPKRLSSPVKIKKNGKVWTYIDDEILRDFSFQETLF